MSAGRRDATTLPLTAMAMAMATGIVARTRRIVAWIARPWLAQLLLRLALAYPFLNSGLLKWQGVLQLSDTAVYLFTDAFRLHLLGGSFRYPAPELLAYLSACGEVLLPTLLIVGLGSRCAALGLVAMTAVIQLTVPDGWPVHLTWVAMGFGIAAWGPGRFSIDDMLGDRSARS